MDLYATVLTGKPEEKKHLGDLGIHGRILLKWVLEKQGQMTWARFMPEDRDHRALVKTLNLFIPAGNFLTS